MSNFHSCPKCDRIIWTDRENHTCSSIEFHRHGYDGEGEWNTKYFSQNYDHEMIAQKLAEQDFYEDPGNLSSYEFDVTVRKDETEKRFLVTGEPDIHWSTKKKSPSTPEGGKEE